MRTQSSTILLLASVLVWTPAALAQHAPRIAGGPEVGAELRLSDDVITLAGIYLAPLGPRTDARAGLGIADPDDGDSDVFLTGGLRTLLARSSPRFPLDIALDAELNLIFSDDTALALLAGPSFGGRAGERGVFIPYIQPLLVVVSDGDTETDIGVRIGADYGLTPTLDLRGDVTFDGDAELRAALYFLL